MISTPERILALEKEIKRLKQPQLANSSIEDGALLVNQLDGTPGLQVGKQYDDTQIAASLTGPVPPTPIAPIVSSASGGALVLWDGTFVDNVVSPLDFTGVDVVASLNPGADPIGTPPLSRIISARGGGQFLALDEGTWYIWLVTRTAAGKASAPSVVQSVEVTPVVSDGLKPAPVPSVTALGGLGDIILTWVPPPTNENGGPQTERVTYDIYAGVDVGSAQIVSHDISGTITQIRNLADGTDFMYFEPPFLADGVTPNPVGGAHKLYYFWIVAKDSDGASLPSQVVTGSMNQLASADIRAGSITASMFAGIVILGSTISTRALDPDTGQLVGPGIDLTPDGFYVYDQAGNPLVEMPNDPNLAKVWRGDAEIDHLTVKTLTTLQETLLSQGSVLTLQSGVANPSNPPTPSLRYTTKQYTDDGYWPDRRGWSTDGTSWYTARNDGSRFITEKWAADGTKTSSVIQSGFGTIHGTVFGFSYLWVLSYYEPFAGNPYYIITAYDTSLTYLGGYNLTSDIPNGVPSTTAQKPDGGSRGVALGHDKVTGELLLAQSRTTNSDKVRIRRFDPNGNSGAGAWGSSVDTPYGYPYDLMTILTGSFDMGGGRYIFTRGGTGADDVQTIFTSGAIAGADAWNVNLGAGLRGLTWDTRSITGTRTIGSAVLTGVASTVGVVAGQSAVGTGFPAGTVVVSTTSTTVTLSSVATSTSAGSVLALGSFKAMNTEGLMQTYENGGNKLASGPSELWYIAYVLTNGAAKTGLSGIATFTMKSRAKLYVAMPALITGVTGTEVYLAKGGTVPNPAVASMRKQGVGTGTPPRITISNASFGANDNPTANGFGAGTPARIRSATGRTFLTGNDLFQAPDKFKSGTETVNAVSGTQVSTTVVFAEPFPAGLVPRIFTGMQDANTAASGRSCTATGVSENGFTLRTRLDSTTTIHVAWFAIAPDQ